MSKERLAEIFTAIQNDTANLKTAQADLEYATTFLATARTEMKNRRSQLRDMVKGDVVSLCSVTSYQNALTQLSDAIPKAVAAVATLKRKVKVLEDSLQTAQRDYDALAAATPKPKRRKKS